MSHDRPRDGDPVRPPSYTPLHPVSFLRRAGQVHADRTGVIDGDVELSYGELWSRAQRLAGGLRAAGTAPGDRVAVLAPNTTVMLEAHTGVPACGAVLVALNIRLTAADLGAILAHSGARILIADHEFAATASGAVAAAGTRCDVVISNGVDGDYEALLATAEPLDDPLDDELGLLALNYTSGTTGRPKGVMYNPRGAYLQAMAMALHMRLGPESRFLWTLPMFHCNGWCFTWAVTAAGGTHVGLRRVTPDAIWDAIARHGITHFNAAPTVLTDLVENAPSDAAGRSGPPIRVGTGGSPPTPTLLARLAELGIEVTHLYGLTETYGPSVVCDWHPEWSTLGPAEQAALKARQGVGNVITAGVRVVDPLGVDVAADASTVGEITVSGNNVMAGYLDDPAATVEAIPDGWFRTGDLGVMHPDGYVELKDRAKDVIISGGENIASVEVERAIASHPAVAEVAVVAMPHPRWGEAPAAFVTLRRGAVVTEEEIVAHARSTLAGYKIPRRVIFGDLPKNATGKVQKFALRELAGEGPEEGG
ncbi:MAG: AMP-binding protein [Acidimicrobiales bacterium]